MTYRLRSTAYQLQRKNSCGVAEITLLPPTSAFPQLRPRLHLDETAKMPHFPMDTGFQPSKDASDDPHHPSIQVKNRRKRYLDLHPEYFSAELELAGPLALRAARSWQRSIPS